MKENEEWPEEQLEPTRRQFLQRLALGTGAALGVSLLDELDALARPQPRLRFVIVGAGLAGLCAAYELEQHGHTVVLLEAEASHVGGRVRTEHFGSGLYGELGAMRIPASHHLARRYIQRFGLALRPFVQFNPSAYYYTAGRRQRIKHAGHLNHLYTHNMEPTEGSIWAQEFSEIVGGMDLLPAAFAARLRSKPKMGCAVIRLEQDAARRRVAAVYQEREGGQARGKAPQQRVEGDFLLCTLPLPILRRLEIEPAFSPAKQRAIRELPYLAAHKVLAVTVRRFWESQDGIFGGGTFTDLPGGITYYPSDNARTKSPRLSAGPGVLLASYTIGRGAQHLEVRPPAERSALVLHDLARVHPQLAQAGMVRQAVCWSWSQHEWSRGGFAWPGRREELHRPIVAPEGRIFFAGEHTSLVHTWMQGALESALLAVREMLASSRR